MKFNYEDIINLPRHVSKKHPQMKISDRAAQFSPFAALTGYGDAIGETARLTDKRTELSEDIKYVLNERLRIISTRIKDRPEISVTFFQPDENKEGGMYITVTDTVKKIDEHRRILVMSDGKEIPIDGITGIGGGIFSSLSDTSCQE